MQLAGFDERSDAGPVLRPLIVTGEERILAIEHDGADASFDDVGVELDAAVVEEKGELVPMVQGVADGFGDHRLGRDARGLLLEPGLERQHERPAPRPGEIEYRQKLGDSSAQIALMPQRKSRHFMRENVLVITSN